jgi:voltage-gated potassium channel Kch
MNQSDPAAFNHPLSGADAIYFSVTTLTTVGFGDLVPVSRAARLAVAGQMLFDLVLLAGFISAVFGQLVERRRA